MSELLKKLSLDEKICLLVGADFWNTQSFNGKIPHVTMTDGPSGVRCVKDEKTLYATAMPTLSSLANTWNKELCFLDGETIAD